MEKYIRTATDGKKYHVWVTTTAPQTGVIVTPWTDKGLILSLAYTNKRDAERASSLLVKGL